MATHHNGDVLVTAAPLIGDGHRMCSRFELNGPQLLARFGFKGAHLTIDGAGGKYHSAGSRRNSAEVRRPRILDTQLLQRGETSEGRLPRNVSGLGVDRV